MKGGVTDGERYDPTAPARIRYKESSLSLSNSQCHSTSPLTVTINSRSHYVIITIKSD